ncbi:MAG: dephospho-CoA kinase [Candidatus Omnitrophica bacterium]|nr:dephospho-CoA kinase [Candidatus Omnitrophota bacterium]
MKIIGVTGAIATGKSTVSEFFRKLGAYVIDLDKIVHLLLEKDLSIYKEVISNFGKGILDRKGRIDRRRLSKKVFVNNKELENLCRVIHPAVIRSLKNRLDEIGRKTPESIVIVDAPLLIEADLLDLVDTVIVVKASRQNQFKRGIKKLRLSRKDIEKRMNSQIPLTEKERFADFIIDNDSTRSNTEVQVKRIFDIVNRRGL